MKSALVIVLSIVAFVLFPTTPAYADIKHEGESSVCTGTIGSNAGNYSGGSYRDASSSSATSRIACTVNAPANSSIQLRTFDGGTAGAYSYELNGTTISRTAATGQYVTWTLVADTGSKPSSHTFSLWRNSPAVGAFPVLDYILITAPECDTNLARIPAEGGGCSMKTNITVTSDDPTSSPYAEGYSPGDTGNWENITPWFASLIFAAIVGPFALLTLARWLREAFRHV